MGIDDIKPGESIKLSIDTMFIAPNCFEIIRKSKNAVQLQNSEHKNIWLPKSIIEYDSIFKFFGIAPWFRSKLSAEQKQFLRTS